MEHHAIKDRKAEGLCVFLPRVAALEAIAQWAAAENVDVERARGGCVRSEANIPLELSGRKMFDCISLPPLSAKEWKTHAGPRAGAEARERSRQQLGGCVRGRWREWNSRVRARPAVRDDERQWPSAQTRRGGNSGRQCPVKQLWCRRAGVFETGQPGRVDRTHASSCDSSDGDAACPNHVGHKFDPSGDAAWPAGVGGNGARGCGPAPGRNDSSAGGGGVGP